MQAPHYLRFARALALVSGVASACACSQSHGGDDASVAPVDAPAIPDAPPVAVDAPLVFVDAGNVCDICRCYLFEPDAGDGAPDCTAIGAWDCCPIEGPLPPPDLPA